jgi:hypothetical protein
MRWRPSPSLVVSVVALVFAAAGTSIAAVNFARNAGAVDHKSAVSGNSTLKHASGKLVATAKSGPLTGKVKSQFLDLSGVVAGTKATFAQGVEVVDNATSTAVGLGALPGVGIVSVTCVDQNAKAAVEDPTFTLSFSNTSGQTVNFSRSTGAGAPTVTTVPAATQNSFTVNNTNTFHLYAQVGASHYVVDGVLRQDGQGTAAGVCAVYGYALAL